MKRLTLLLCLALGLHLSLWGQGFQRWTIGLSSMYEELEGHSDSRGVVLVPSLRYNLAPGWSIGSAFLLPLATIEHASAKLFTTGVELSLRREMEVAPNLLLSLSAVGLWGIIGPYEKMGAPCCAIMPRMGSTERPEVHVQSYRWLVGLRPAVSYRFSSRWRMELGYGFLGYRSNKDLDDTYRVEDDKRIDAWGLNAQMGWGNSFRLGVGYTF